MLAALAQLLMVADPGVGPSIMLNNAASPGVAMPLVGLGMPCGYTCPVCPGYGCKQSSYDATLTFLALGGRHTDSADSYTDAEPGIGLAMREWIAASPSNKREELFIGSKIGPGGGCWPLGYNESIAQARMIIGYYNQLPSSVPTANVTELDLLLIHWPINCGPCAVPGTPDGHCPTTIPTTDPACDVKLPTYSEKGCRISTWRGMLAAWKLGLTRSVGVSNFNSTHMQDLKDAGLPLPAANQIEWNPGITVKPFVPYPHAETFASLRAWCVKNGVLVNSYSPFGGNGKAGATFSQPAIKAIAAAHNVSAAQAVLRWNVQQNIPVIPMATNPQYQEENMDIFGFNLTGKEMECMGSLSPSVCPPPPPTPPPQRNCSFTLAGAGTISLQALPKGPFALTDSIGDKYAVTSPCGRISGPNAPTGFTESPAVEDIGTSDLDKIPLGFLAQLTTEKLPAWPATHAEQGGMTLVLGGGVANPGCVASKGRILQYNMVCCQTCAASAPPNSTMIIPGTIPNTTIASCTYVVEWHHPAACAPK